MIPPDNTVEFVSMPGFRHLQVGDIVRVDGGPQIVVRANGSGVVIEPVTRKHRTATTRFGKEFTVADKLAGTHRSRNWPRDMVLYHCNDPECEAFLAGVAKLNQETEAKMKGMVTLEPGDALCYHNKVCCVVAVTDDGATLGDMDGNEYAESRRVNEFYFDFADCGKPGCTVHQRFDSGQRAEFLKTFLATRKPPVRAEGKKQLPGAGDPQPAGAVTVSGETENPVEESETNMSKKAKVKKGKAGRKPRAVKASNGSNGHMEKIFGFSVCSVLRRLGKEGVTAEQASQILAANKITMPEQSMKVQLSLFKQRPPADLTGEQVKELKALAS